MTTPGPVGTQLAHELERAHAAGVRAAIAGLQDAALGGQRLRGEGVTDLAEAAVSSATPFLRAPLLARMSQVLLLHRPAGVGEPCPECRSTPCPTARVLRW